MENDSDDGTLFTFSVNADAGSLFQLNEEFLGQLVVDGHRKFRSVRICVGAGVHVLPVAGSLLGVLDFLLNHFQHRTVKTIRGALSEIAVGIGQGVVNSGDNVQSIDSVFHF